VERHLPPFDRFLGTRIVSAANEELVVELVLEPHHLNKRGVAHGGVVLSLLDSAMGGALVAAMPQEWWCATTSLSTQFLRGPGAGRIRARGRVVRLGRSVAFVAGELSDADGRLAAVAHGTWRVWDRRPGAPAPSADEASSANASGAASSPAYGCLRSASGEVGPRVGKIVAVGRNYAAHAAEMGAPAGGPPIFFLKPATALAHDGETIALPTGAGAVHHEVELVAVIGTRGRHIARQRALDHVAGWAVGVDLTLRDLQREAKERGEPWSVAKGFDGAAPLSAWIPRDRAGDGDGLEIRLSINGELRQQGTTSSMLRSTAELVAEISRFMTVEPGDLLFTGTPEGVGPVVPGDRLEASIERVGRLCVSFVEEQRSAP
jgi:uncharacterized protein (TIGR00369 family)